MGQRSQKKYHPGYGCVKTASIRGFRRTYLEVKDDDDDEGAEDEEQEVHPQDVNSDVDAIQPQSGRTQLDREGPSVVVELQDLRGILPLPIWLREKKECRQNTKIHKG